MVRRIAAVLVTVGLAAGIAFFVRQRTEVPGTGAAGDPATVAGGPHKEAIDGIRNFTVVDATVGCAGATDVEAIPRVAARGYKAIVNLRAATEPGAAIDDSRAAAAAAGLTFIHLPFNGAAPDPAVADAFITAVTNPANQPVFITCASANRVGALWLTKRMLVDKWDRDRAVEEARLIGLSSDALEDWAIGYVAGKGQRQ